MSNIQQYDKENIKELALELMLEYCEIQQLEPMRKISELEGWKRRQYKFSIASKRLF